MDRKALKALLKNVPKSTEEELSDCLKDLMVDYYHVRGEEADLNRAYTRAKNLLQKICVWPT